MIALSSIQSDSVSVTVDYFTGSLFLKKYLINGVVKRFWPISNSILRKRHVWRKQFSKSCLKYYKNQTPDITIINMSGLVSPFSIDLSKVILKNNKQYIAMIGGMSMAYNDDTYEYYKKAHHIIVHTELQKKEILNHNMFSNLDIKVLPLGIDINKFRPVDSFKNEIEGKLLCVSRITPLKQIEIAIETLKHLKINNFKKAGLTIIGPISDKTYYNQLKRQINELSLNNDVIFLGAIHQEQILSYYQNSDLLLLPSKTESFGMVMVEAMSCGTPVATLHGTGGPDEIILNNFNGILTSEERYSESVLSLLLDNEKYKILRQHSRTTILKKYSIEETTRVLKESINSALNS